MYILSVLLALLFCAPLRSQLQKVSRRTLPRVSDGEGFFGRSAKPPPPPLSILSFLAADLGGEVSMSEDEICERGATQRRAVRADPSGGHSDGEEDAFETHSGGTQTLKSVLEGQYQG